MAELEADDNADRAREIAYFASGLLGAQKITFTDEYGMLREKARDKWSLGYVGGFADAALQKGGIPHDTSAHAAMAIVFMEVFGQQDGATYFGKFMDLQQANDPDLFAGLSLGGNEFIDWVKDNDKYPLGWGGHVHAVS